MIVLSTIPGLLLGQRYVTRCAYYWGLGTHVLLRRIVGIEHEIRGKEHWDSKPALFACKHESTLETTMIQVLAFDSAIILKRELTWIPFLGQAMLKSGVIPINRSKGKKVFTQIIEGARHFTAQGRPLFVFPEGTRKSVDDPTHLRAGIAILYEDLNLPVYPVALNTGLVWGRRDFLKRPGKVIYEILPPIMPGLSKEEFLATLTKALEDKTQELRLEARTWQEAQKNKPISTARQYLGWVLGGFFLLALIGYTAAWHRAAGELEKRFEAFKDTCTKKGWVFSHAPLHVSGYPFHVRAHLPQVSLLDPAFGSAIFDKGLTIETSISSFDKASVSAPVLTLTSTRIPFTLTSHHMGGDLYFRFYDAKNNLVTKNQLSQIDIGLADIRIEGLFQKDVTAKQIKLKMINALGIHPANFHLQAVTLKSPLLPIPELEEVTLSLSAPSLNGDRNDSSIWQAFHNWQASDGPVTGDLHVKALPLDAWLEGSLVLNQAREIEGATSLYIKGLDPFLDTLVQTKHLSFLAAQGYKLAFSMATSFAKSRGVKARADGQVPLALTLQDGVLSLGQFPLGRIPALTWKKEALMPDAK